MAKKAYKLTKKMKKKIIEMLEEGQTLIEIAKALGISRTAIWYARKQDSEFDKQVVEARDKAVEMVEDALFLKAMSGDTTAMIFYLKNRAPERWSDRREVSVLADKVGKIIVELPGVSDENSMGEKRTVDDT